MVRLLLKSSASNMSALSSFNPTMVRLLRFCHNRSEKQFPVFQSHNGAIAACWRYHHRKPRRCCLSIPQWCDCCLAYKLQAIALERLSIPQWCDCCFWTSFRFRSHRRLSIPQWCDCCPQKPPIHDYFFLTFNPTMVRLLPLLE